MVRRYPHTVETGVRFSAGPNKNDVENPGSDSVSLEKHGSAEKVGSGCVFPELPNAGREKQGSGLDFHDFLLYAEHIATQSPRTNLNNSGR